jgi:hypothetical protein
MKLDNLDGRRATAILLFGLTSLLFGQQKLAQTGFQFLSVGVNAQAAAMGEAYNACNGNSTALFYNPAGLTGMAGAMDISLNSMQWIADINYLSGSAALNIGGGRYGVVGLSFMTADYGKFYWTSFAKNDQGYEDIPGWGSPSILALGVGYARELSDRFSVGGQIKYANQDLGNSYVPNTTVTDSITSIDVKQYSRGVLAFDFGTLYKTGLKSLVFGMSVRNFSKEIKYEAESFQLPLTFKIGIAMNVLDFLPVNPKQHALTVAVDAVHPRDYPEYLNIGGEYRFMELLSLRAGYITNQFGYDITAGFGVKKYGFAIDYAYMPFSLFDTVNRFSLRFSL